MLKRPFTRNFRTAPWSPWRSIHLPLLCKNSCRPSAGIVDVDHTRPEEFEAWHGEGTRTLGVLDDHLRTRSFVVGEAMSIADLALYSYVHRAEEGGFALSGLSGLRRWFERIERRPRHIAIDSVPGEP